MIIYEQERSNKNHYLYHQSDINLNFPLHMHNSYEFIAVTSGNLEITVQDKIYTLEKNDCAIIFPDVVHSYYTKETSKSYLCIFSTDYVNEFYKKTEHRIAINPIFTIDNVEKTIYKLQKSSNVFELKSELYHILSILYNSTNFEKQENKNNFAHEALTYIEKHFDEDITLKEVASDLGYTYNYTSTLFNQIFKTSFATFLNSYRISQATQMLAYSKKSISEIAITCGYNSLRAFNRNFQKFKNTTPSEFQKNYSDYLKLR